MKKFVIIAVAIATLLVASCKSQNVTSEETVITDSTAVVEAVDSTVAVVDTLQ